MSQYSQPWKLNCPYSKPFVLVFTVCLNVQILPTAVVGRSYSKRPIIPSGLSTKYTKLPTKQVFEPLLQTSPTSETWKYILILLTVIMSFSKRPIIPSVTSKCLNTSDEGSRCVFSYIQVIIPNGMFKLSN